MLIDILDIPMAYAAVSVLTAFGIGIKLLLGSIYKRDIRNARSIEHTKKRWMKRMKRNFEKIFSDGLSRDAELFVENEMNSRQILGITLKRLDCFINQLPLVIVTATAAFDFWFVDNGFALKDLTSFTLYGATMCLAIHTFNMLVNNGEKENRLRIILTQYFSNEKLPLILMNQYADEKLIGRKENINPNTLVAAAVSDTPEKQENAGSAAVSRANRKKLKAERLRLKRLIKNQRKEERIKRQETRELMKQQALKAAYEEKMKRLQEKYRLEPEGEPASEAVSMTLAASGAELGQEVESILQAKTPDTDEKKLGPAEQIREKEMKKDVLNQTLNEAFPENKTSRDDEKLIEEVLKEYLFR